MSVFTAAEFHWEETSPGNLSRPLGTVETYLVRVAEQSQPHEEKCIYVSAFFILRMHVTLPR